MTAQVDSPSGAEGRTLTAPARRALLGACVGTVIEWFDYALFTSFAAILAGGIFFPNLAPGVGVLAAFATYGAGFFVRPLGGFVLGRLGDRYGRKPVLVLTLTLMGFSTVAVGFLPTYAMVGVWAPVLLVCLRLVQGFGAGAESAGAIALVAEHTPLRRRGLFTGMVQSSQIFGALLASLVFLAVSGLPQAAFAAWGWRVPFWSAAALFLVAIYLRSRLEESAEYVSAMEQARDRGDEAPHPLRTLFSRLKMRLLLGFVVMCSLNTVGTMLTVFIPSYLRTVVGLPTQTVFVVSSVGFVVGVVAGTLAGLLCDVVGFRRVFTIAALVTVPGVFLLLATLRSGSVGVLVLAISAAFLLSYAGMTGPSPGLLTNIFPTEVRYSGVAVVKELSSALAVGTLPVVATALVLVVGGSPWLLATYVAVWCVLGAVAMRVLGRVTETPETRNLVVA